MSFSRREGSTRKTGPNGEILCSCGCGRPPGPGRRYWHSQECVDQWNLRNNPAYARQLIYKRDRGKCASCGLDVSKEFPRIKEAAKEIRRYYEWWWRVSPVTAPGVRAEIGTIWDLHEAVSRTLKEKFPGWSLSRSTGWDVDHIVPVAEGGGQCDLDNLQTLCMPCHRQKTAEMNRRRFRKNRT